MTDNLSKNTVLIKAGDATQEFSTNSSFVNHKEKIGRTDYASASSVKTQEAKLQTDTLVGGW